MRNRGFGRLRQKDCHAVALHHTAAAQGVGELIGTGLEIVEAIARGAAVALLVDQRETARTIGPFVAHVHADVESLGNLPCKACRQSFIRLCCWKHRFLLVSLKTAARGSLRYTPWCVA